MSGRDNSCCPEFHPERWDAKTLTWDHKPFIRASLPTFFHIPFPPMVGWKITKLWSMAERAKAVPEDKEDALILFSDPSPFKSLIHLSVTGTVPGAEQAALSGTFMTKVFDGAYNDIPRFIKEMDAHLAALGKKADRYYVHYAYCPGCAKKFGHNYVLLFAQV